MPGYYVNKTPQTNGDHEVHTESCQFLPSEWNRIYLGIFGNCADAIREAKKRYSKANGCYYCSNACHTR